MEPFVPMSPILIDFIPEGDEWIYQLKWDGYRIIASIDHGAVELYTKKMLPKNGEFPELVHALSKIKRTCIVDGEAVIMDPITNRPSFLKMQQRDKKRDSRSIQRSSERDQVQYVLFDLLELDGKDLRDLPFIDRHEQLKDLIKDWGALVHLADLFDNGAALWDWVVANKWEGIVSKRLSSRYTSGKEYKDWYKRKTIYEAEVEIVGILMKEGRISSLVMRKDGEYLGRNSSGLNGKLKAILNQLPAEKTWKDYFPSLPDGLKGFTVRWLDKPFTAEVSGAELTEAGTLRHPRLESLTIYSLKIHV